MNIPDLDKPHLALLKPTAISRIFSQDPGVFSVVQAQAIQEPKLILFNTDLAQQLGVSELASDDLFWAGNANYGAHPIIALVYSGHQFGVWAGQLGDGRAMTIGSLIDQFGNDQEIQFKGAGPTPYSRRADGRAVLRSSIREFLCSEAFAALGIPTTRALALATSSTPVFRETAESAAVVTRVAPSFLRFGSFEHWFYNDKPDQLAKLTEFVVTHYFTHLKHETNSASALLAEVVDRTAKLIAQWQGVGFCHGVMNTDNMSILGLTMDYGPFGFLDTFDPAHICNHTDQQGRYSYRNQPAIGQWNCFALGQALANLIGGVEPTKAILAQYAPTFETAIKAVWRSKIGITRCSYLPDSEDDTLIDSMFKMMETNRVDWTLFFRSLADVRSADSSGDAKVRDLCLDRVLCDEWLNEYRVRLAKEPLADDARRICMNKINPKYVLRNHLAQVAIEAAEKGDFTELQRLYVILQRPFDEQTENASYASLPPEWASTLEVSCSS